MSGNSIQICLTDSSQGHFTPALKVNLQRIKLEILDNWHMHKTVHIIIVTCQLVKYNKHTTCNYTYKYVYMCVFVPISMYV